jgi:C4-dicarboxylate-specific signal transduction histidine kinase
MALARRAAEDPDILAAIAAVERNAVRAGDIVNWIRRQSSRAETQRSFHDVNTLVRSALEQRERQLSRSQIALSFEATQALPPVQVDPIGIEQVVANLVRNAADALAEQPGVRTIHVETRLQGGVHGVAGVEVLVRDNGPGLQGRTIDALCSTFYTTKKEGLGLGLGICRAIAESHSGKLAVCENPEGGAEFSVFLPVPFSAA